MNHSRDELALAFPSSVRSDVTAALSILSENRFSSRWQTYSVRVGNELVWIPYRIHYDPPALHNQRLTDLQSELLDCLFSRHHDGFVRQDRVNRIIRSPNSWIPGFVVQLVGEYVVEILRVVQDNLPLLDASLYGEFLRDNPKFLAITKQRVESYWDCYYRSIKRAEYPGFRILEFFESVARTNIPHAAPKMAT